MTCVQLQVVQQIDLIMYNCDTGGIPQNCDLDSVAMDIDTPEIDKFFQFWRFCATLPGELHELGKWRSFQQIVMMSASCSLQS